MLSFAEFKPNTHKSDFSPYHISLWSISLAFSTVARIAIKVTVRAITVRSEASGSYCNRALTLKEQNRYLSSAVWTQSRLPLNFVWENEKVCVCWRPSCTASSIILIGNQLDARFLIGYVYLNPLHVSSNYVLILRRTIVLIQYINTV